MMVNFTFEQAQRHRKKCRNCCYPIIDDEGNPGRFSDACDTGLPLLVRYVRALGESVPKWADEKVPA